MRELVYYVAVTLDGFIAHEDGSFEAPFVHGGAVYTGSGLVEQSIFLIDLESGEANWQLSSGWSAHLAVDKGVLYASSGDDFLAISPTSGELLWRFETGGLARQPTIFDRTAYFGSDDCQFYALKLRDP